MAVLVAADRASGRRGDGRPDFHVVDGAGRSFARALARGEPGAVRAAATGTIGHARARGCGARIITGPFAGGAWRLCARRLMALPAARRLGDRGCGEP